MPGHPRKDLKHRTVHATVAYRVRHTRRARRWTQQHLAERAGLCRKTIHDLESEKHPPTLETLLRIAQALRTTVGYLIAETDHRAPTKRLSDKPPTRINLKATA